MTRAEKIEFLVDRDLDTIAEQAAKDDFTYAASILRDGFKGYANFTDEELDAEVKEAHAIDEEG